MHFSSLSHPDQVLAGSDSPQWPPNMCGQECYRETARNAHSVLVKWPIFSTNTWYQGAVSHGGG